MILIDKYLPVKTIFEINEEELIDALKHLKPRERKSIILLRLNYFFFFTNKEKFLEITLLTN